MRFEEIQKKAGVSLVTVLLFMLVATIAATATYKWLTSEGRSSASRMQQNEAYQSAVAGIESARSWMTYNANETGAIIKQYKDGKNSPINLTDRLAAFMRAGQHFNVYLVGVNTEKSTYKLKLLSEGTARNGGAKHSEVAILNVNGLYRVTKPTKTIKVHTDFEYAYFGGSLHYEGSNDVTSMVVNGNWDHNPPKTTSGDFIVTGNANLSGNRIDVAKTTCIGGTLSTTNGITTKDFYVAGKATNFTGVISGDAYFDGDLEMSSACGDLDFHVLGNMTVNATVNFDQCNTRVVKGNTCVLENGQIKTNGRSVKLEGGAWMQADYPIWKDNDDNYNQSENFVVGTDEGTKVYIKSGHPWSDYSALRTAKTFTEKSDHPQRCIKGLGTYSGGEKCNDEYTGKWKDEVRTVYPAKAQKDDLYYLYYMQPGYTDVDFGSYDDSYWKWENSCWTMWGWGTCYDPKTIMNGYFINFQQKNINYTFTNSYHEKDCDGPSCYNHHKTNVPDKGWYRYLNYNEEGTKITGSPFCGLKEGFNFVPECGVKPWFTMKGKFMPWVNTKPDDITCAESVKDHCFSVWEEAPGCDGSNYVVRDQLKIAYDKFQEFENKAPCAKQIADRAENDLNGSSEFTDLKTCYDNTVAHDAAESDSSKKQLYNEYLVVKLRDSKFFKKTQNGSSLSGKYIFVLDEPGPNPEAMKLPSTATSNDFVMIYLRKGYHKNSNSEIHLEGSGLFNYFIFSDSTIYGVQGKNHTLSGTIYMKQASCAKLQHIWTSNLVYNPDLMNSMMVNGIICPASATTCGGTGTPISSSESVTVEYTSGGPDDYYISVAPQLSVTLESQYKNSENIGDATRTSNVEGSFIVLPRIIYLTKDARGKLSDYYNLVPLNAVTPQGSSSPISGASISCESSVPVNGKLTAEGDLPEGEYACEATATVNGKTGSAQKKVPFWVVVAGEGGAAPTVSFAKASEELAIGNETAVELKWEKTTGAGIECKVVVSATDYEPAWGVEKAAGIAQDGNEFTITFNTSNETPKKIFDVRNNSSSDGSVLFLIKDVQGCTPGDKPVEVIYNTNSITVERKGLAEYCNGEAGSGVAACNPGGDYHKMLQPDWPDCSAGDEVWVVANGNNCSTINDNNKWSCGITGEVSLSSPNTPTGCQVVIPSTNNTKTGPFEPNETITLYAALKAIPQTFHVAFDVTGSLPDDQPIYISVDGSARSVCTYGDYKDAVRRAEKCDISIYRGATVKLSFNSNPSEESDPPSQFNYWLCSEGADCESDDPNTASAFIMTITGSNTVEAHFGETDKHCFFDEFKDSTRYNRPSVECSESNPRYCIETCDGVCGTVATGVTKWRLLEGSMDIIDYADGRISLKSKATRGKKESAKANVRAVVMSTAQAGKDGELKAQFQVPFEGVSAGDIAKATVKNSGFILRSDPSKLNFLMLNVFATSSGTLKARLCVNGADDRCKTLTFSNLRTISATDIIMMSAKLATNAGVDQLKVKVWPGSWATDLQADEVTFNLVESEISGITATAKNEYVGYSLADQNFKLYGIGWKSDTYNAKCWETFPTISCSFKAAYTGGIVPKDESVEPWVGFSAWYNDAHVSGCHPEYYYNGNDDNGCITNIPNTDYRICGNNYRFTEAGAHGYTDAEQKEKNTAKASVKDCYEGYSVNGIAAAWANQGVVAHCGAFWVGEMKECSKHVTFEYTSSGYLDGYEGDYYKPASSTANVRDADLKVELDNPAGDEVDIYLFSVSSDGMYTYGSNPIYSLPYKTTGNGTITIPVKNLSNVDGFNPEKVGGVYVKTDGTARVNSVASSCPYVITINSCSAEYDKSAAKWKVSTKVNNYTHTNKIDVRETSGYISGGDTTCGESSPCTWSGISGNLGTNILPLIDANPYDSIIRNYTFSVTLTPDEGSPMTCNTAPVSTSTYGRECGTLSGGTTFKQGLGIPVFSYAITCPKGPCGYTITLSDGTSILSTTTDDDANTNTNSNAANMGSAEKPDLDVGSYYFVLHSTSNQFPDCKSGTFNITSSAITANCDIAGNLYQGQTLTLNVSSISGDVSSGGSDMIWTLTDGGSNTVTKTITCNTSSCWNNQLTAPAAGDYTYSLTFGGRNVCSGNITIANASDEVTAVCSNKDAYPGFTVNNFITMSNLNNIDNNTPRTVKINDNTVGTSSNCNKNSCEDMQMTAPNTTGEYTYYLYFDGQEKCHGTLTVNPKLTCEVNKTSLTLGESFTFTASYGGNSWNTSFTGNGVSHNNNQMSYTITPTASGTQSYNFSVTGGSIGEASCETINIEVGEASPTATCPPGTINAEPGTTIQFTPTVTGCSSGCNYTVDWLEGSTTKKSVTNYGYTSGQISFTGDAAGGNNTYRFTIENKKTSDNSADCEITVNYQRPTYNCPTDKEEAVGATVAVTPTSVTNCTQGCNYKVTKGSSTGTEVIGPGTGYTSGALGSGFTGESTAQTVTYYVTLSNPAGDGTACDFDVTYTEQTCTEYMTQYVIGQNDGNKDNIGPFSAGCYKINTGKACSSTQIYTSGSGTVTVNGSQFDCSKNYQVVSITPQAIMDVSIENCTVTKFYVYDCNAVASSSSVTPASSGSGGGGGGAIAITTDSEISIPAGTHSVTCTGAGTISCGHYIGDYSTQTITLDGNSCNVGQEIGWQNCGGGSCKSSAQTLVTSVGIKCKAMY
ncbi:pilus assembly PilX family protein [Fibrobacter sp.]